MGSGLDEGVPVPGAPLDIFWSLALENITVKPSADAGLFTSHSPNLGNGRPISCDAIRRIYAAAKCWDSEEQEKKERLNEERRKLRRA